MSCSKQVGGDKINFTKHTHMVMLQIIRTMYNIGFLTQSNNQMNIFKHRHFKYDIIIWAVRWYCKYRISYRDPEEMLGERDVEVDHCTIYRWVVYYAPLILDQLEMVLETEERT